MFKLLIKGAIIGISALALATAANAGTYEINMYGASAQYKYWNGAADDFMTSIGCTGVTQGNNGSKHGVTEGTCDIEGDGTADDTLIIRYSAKASYDGLYSCKGEATVPGGQPSCSGVGPRYRELADTPSDTTLVCKDVVVGMSDVAGSTFGQVSHGQLKGHLGGGWVDRSVGVIDMGTIPYFRPIVVPFAFFANTAVGSSVTNLTRSDAGNIFSGNIFWWTDFAGNRTGYPSKEVIACLRHAGSGTHATLNAAVMRGDYALLAYEDAPYVYFNDGSSDELNCIAQNAGESTSAYAAVGYMDYDGCDGEYGVGGKCENMKMMQYEGVDADRDNILVGPYSFWSAQWMYNCGTVVGDAAYQAKINDLVEALAAYASDAATNPLPNFPTQSEMKVQKPSDFDMPTFIQP